MSTLLVTFLSTASTPTSAPSLQPSCPSWDVGSAASSRSSSTSTSSSALRRRSSRRHSGFRCWCGASRGCRRRTSGCRESRSWCDCPDRILQPWLRTIWSNTWTGGSPFWRCGEFQLWIELFNVYSLMLVNRFATFCRENLTEPARLITTQFWTFSLSWISFLKKHLYVIRTDFYSNHHGTELRFVEARFIRYYIHCNLTNVRLYSLTITNRADNFLDY